MNTTIEFGTKGAASPGHECYFPKDANDDATILCDRDYLHLGNHAGWDDNGKRVYWKKPLDIPA